MVAVLASTQEPTNAEEAFLREQLDSLADELWDRVYRPQQKLWLRADCPWCRKLRARGTPDLPCPICDAFKRSRDDEGDVIRLPFPVYEPDQKESAIVRLFVDYRIPSTRPKRTRKAQFKTTAKQYAPEAEWREWDGRLTMRTPIPTSRDEIDAFAQEVGDQVRREMKRRPPLTVQP